MEIRKISFADNKIIQEIVPIHLNVLKDSFLNNFGKKFLKIIYSNLIDSPEVICLTLYEKNKVEGFALAIKDYSLFFKIAISKNKAYLFFIVGSKIILQPITAYKLLRSLPSIFFSKETHHAELQFIAVSPAFQGMGLGSSLIKQLVKEFKKNHINQLHVGTKSKDPLSNKFYQKMGFTKEYSKTYFGEELNYYTS